VVTIGEVAHAPPTPHKVRARARLLPEMRFKNCRLGADGICRGVATSCMLWTKYLKRLNCPHCGAKGTLRYAPATRGHQREALRYRCTVTVPMVCGFVGFEDEAPLQAALAQLLREQPGLGI
jgi:hypothetical protein